MQVAAQSDRLPSWFVVAFAAGVATFFGWPTDPAPDIVLVAVITTALAGWAAIRARVPWPAFLFVSAIVAGFATAQFRTALVSAPVLERETRSIPIKGRVREVERQPNFVRIVLEDVQLDIAGARPTTIRLTTLARYGAPRVGDRISTTAQLQPPALPPVPGGFQFQRYLFFEGIGATAFTLAPWQAAGPIASGSTIKSRLEGLRRNISDRILATIPGDAGAVAVALITGEQSLIREDVQDDYRASGLAHLLSISGVHMTLLAGVVFAVARRVLAGWAYIALRTDIKKVAAVAALAATAFYLSISGLSVPAVRAFLMVAVVLLAVLLDRRALSLRSVSWAALVVLIFFPEALFGPSFQMSFLAVIALVALYEHYSLQPTWRDRDGRWRLWQGLKLYVGGLILTDVVAGSITSLVAAYHFSNVPIYSAIGNLLAAPITGFWIMPWGLISLALMPFGADGGALAMMGAGVEAINRIASMIAAWPSAQVQTPPMSVGALISVGAGVLVVALWRGSWRWAGLVPITFAALQPWLSQVPDLVVGPESGLVGLTDSSGHLVLSPGRSERFVRSVWVERYGRSDVKWAARESPPPQLGLSCDSAGCVVIRGRWRVSVAASQDAVGDDCGRSDILFAPNLFVTACGSTKTYDRRTFVRDGTHAVWIDNDAIRVESVRDHIGTRIWNRERGSGRARRDPPINNGDRDPPSDPGP